MNKQTQIALACQAGLAYFTGVFALAFLLGVLRRMFLTPMLGAVGAVLLELPILLVFSWVIAGRIDQRMQIPARWRERALIGIVAFSVLMLAEIGLAVAAFAMSLPEYLQNFQSLEGVIGLAGQLVFAVIPLLRLLTGNATSPDSTAPR